VASVPAGDTCCRAEAPLLSAGSALGAALHVLLACAPHAVLLACPARTPAGAAVEAAGRAAAAAAAAAAAVVVDAAGSAAEGAAAAAAAE